MLLHIVSFSEEYLKVLYVADYSTNCGQQKCLMVRSSPEQPYQQISQQIEGFNYKEGFEYCLLVTYKSTDSTSITYTLSEIKSKIKTQNTLNEDVKKTQTILPDSSVWLLYKLRLKDGSNRTFSIQKVFLQFDAVNNTFKGNTGCNTVSGDFTLDSNKIHFDNIITTQAACGKHSIEKEILDALNKAAEIKVSKKLLYLTNGKTLLGLFTKK